jgi:hypothetical protein
MSNVQPPIGNGTFISPTTLIKEYTTGNLIQQINGEPFEESFSTSHWGGTKTPNYQQLKNRGAIIPHNSWKHDRATSTYQSGTMSLVNTSTNRTTEVDHYIEDWTKPSDELFPEHIPWDRKTDFGNLLQSAQRKIEEKNQFDVLTFVAELGSVRRMGTRLYSFLRNASTRREAFRLWDVPSWWLEARYGLRPLVADLVHLYDILRAGKEKRTRYKERVGTSRNFFDSTESEQVYSSSVSSIWRSERTTRNSLRASVVMDIELALDAFDIAPTVWELVPFSFLVDRFISIGTYIRNDGLNKTNTAMTSSIGLLQETVVNKTVSIGNSPNTGSYSSHLQETRTTRQRIPYQVPTNLRPSVFVDSLLALDVAAFLHSVRTQARNRRRRR